MITETQINRIEHVVDTAFRSRTYVPGSTVRGALVSVLGRRPTVDEVVALAREYYKLPGNGAGGSFHIVLDDGNLEDAHVAWCEGLVTGSKDTAGVALGRALSILTEDERRCVYERYEEYGL